MFSLRMFGLFVILPVVALYADTLPGGESAMLIGLAIGIYGLTQAIFQIPLGRLSDFWGRKKTIYTLGCVYLLWEVSLPHVRTHFSCCVLGVLFRERGLSHRQ